MVRAKTGTVTKCAACMQGEVNQEESEQDEILLCNGKTAVM